MKLIGNRMFNCYVRGALVMATFLSFALIGTDAFAAKRVLWESRDQFVAIEEADAVKGGSPIPNNHPVEIGQDRLAEILSSIQLRPGVFGVSVPFLSDPKANATVRPLFTDQSVGFLVPYFQDAFRQAKPNEDVTFAIVGLHLSAGGLAKSPMATAGRMFYQGGKINLIIGKAQYDYSERKDRRLDPFTPGNREYTADGTWALIPQGTTPEVTMVRRDWLAFSDDWKPEYSYATSSGKSGVPEPTTSDALRNLFSGKAGKTAERINVLKELRDQGVITEEEYRAKRLKILDEL